VPPPWGWVPIIYLWSKVVWKCLKLLCGSYWLFNHILNENSKENLLKKLYWKLGMFLVLLESPWQVRFNRVYFTIFRAKVWKILIFSEFCCWKFKQIEKLEFGRKNQWWTLNVFTFLNLEIFNSENVKNTECVHTRAKGTSYISMNKKKFYRDWPE
jgi:hypothetical protein